MGVSADKETTGESIVLQKNLMNDTRAGLPETAIVMSVNSSRWQEYAYVTCYI